MYSHTPPAPPPKPASRMSTPATSQSPRPPPLPDTRPREHSSDLSAQSLASLHQTKTLEDPGDQWLPKFLQDKSYMVPPQSVLITINTLSSKQDLADILSD